MNRDFLIKMKEQLPPQITLVAVSKFHPLEAIREAYAEGQRVFAESRPQELMSKVEQAQDMPDLQWHFIGHLQTNKLKMVLPYADLVQSVDSQRLLDAIEKWGREHGRRINVLLEMHVALEESKQGFYEEEILDILFRVTQDKAYPHICFKGLMGMASHTDDMEQIRADFTRIKSFLDYLQDLFPELESFKELSIGMSDDYQCAIECGSTMVRIGSAIFGERNYEK